MEILGRWSVFDRSACTSRLRQGRRVRADEAETCWAPVHDHETPKRVKLLDALGIRRFQHADQPETRGRPIQRSNRALRYLELQIVRHGTDGRLLQWSDLREELQNIDIEVSIDIIRNWLGMLVLHRCIAGSRSKWLLYCNYSTNLYTGFITEHHAQRRLEYDRVMLQKYPNPEDWHRVRFSDEVHFRYDPEARLRVGEDLLELRFRAPRSIGQRHERSTRMGSHWVRLQIQAYLLRNRFE